MWPEIQKENHWGEKPRGEAGTAASKAAERSGEGRLNVVAFGVSDEEEGRRALVQRSRVGRRPSPRVEGGAGSGVVGKDSEVPAEGIRTQRASCKQVEVERNVGLKTRLVRLRGFLFLFLDGRN